jgi:hypothetical protein
MATHTIFIPPGKSPLSMPQTVHAMHPPRAGGGMNVGLPPVDGRTSGLDAGHSATRILTQ